MTRERKWCFVYVDVSLLYANKRTTHTRRTLHCFRLRGAQANKVLICEVIAYIFTVGRSRV
jgi:hypothetical protein